MSELDNLRAALSQIFQIAGAASVENVDNEYPGDNAGVCTPKALPKDLLVRAAKTATDINPANAPVFGFAPADVDMAGLISDPLRIAVLTSKYWGTARRRLTVSFMETTAADLRNRIISHMNSWNCGVDFAFTTGTGQVRISRGAGGYWSYLGTDITHIATNRQTMNLQGFTMNTPESEYKRVVRHETGHTLGFPHEHMRRQIVALINRQKAYAYFLRTQGWDKATVDQQVLTPLDDATIFGTAPDQTSIMCYQLPGEITNSGQPIVGGLDINATDRSFALRIYPRPGAAVQDTSTSESTYDESEFVREPVLID